LRTARAAFARFVVVGGGTAAASALAIFALVRATGCDPVAAAAIVAVAGNLIGFVANRQWSFLAAHAHPLPQFVRYATVATASTLASVALFAVLTNFVGMHYLLASLCVSGIFAVTNFLAHFHWSFAPGKRLDPSA
jgi:putative flippase GtrA